MVEKAQQMVAGMEIGNVAIIKARLQDGYASEAPYDAIIIEGAVEYMPETLLDQLADGVDWQLSGGQRTRRSERLVSGAKQARGFPE